MAIKRSTKGALILFIILALAILAWFYVKPMFEQRWMRSSSDASSFSEEIRIGGDNYIGYWFVNSPEMRKNAARNGILPINSGQVLDANQNNKRRSKAIR